MNGGAVTSPRESAAPAAGLPGAAGSGFLRTLPLVPPGAARGFFPAWAADPGAFADLLPDPFDPAVAERTAASVSAFPHPREATAAALVHTNETLGGDALAVAAAARIAEPGVLVVVTGQQAGLFGGPLYSLAKAMSAVATARELEAIVGNPVVPVFWVESDDHDFEEVRDAWLLDPAGEARVFRYEPADAALRLPAARRLLDESIPDLVSAFTEALPATDFSGEVAEALHAAYAPGHSLGEAFTRFVLRLTRGTGLVAMDGGAPVFKQSALAVYERAAAGEDGRRRIRRSTARIEAAGYSGQATPEGYGVFVTDESGARRRARAEELAPDALRAAPERLSAAVLLRPLIQDFLLPTLAYVAGPSEIAYHAQIGGLYGLHGIPRPLVTPRHQVTVMNASQLRVVDRDGIDFDELAARDEAALNRVTEDPGVAAAIAATRADLDAGLRAVESAVEALDHSLGPTAQRTRGKMLAILDGLEKRAVRAAKRRDEERRARFLRARNGLFPEGVPQERRLSPAVFRNRYGPGFANWLLASFEDPRADRRARNLLLG